MFVSRFATLCLILAAVLVSPAALAQDTWVLDCTYDPDTGEIIVSWSGGPAETSSADITLAGNFVLTVFSTNTAAFSPTPGIYGSTVVCVTITDVAGDEYDEVCCDVELPPAPVTDVGCTPTLSTNADGLTVASIEVSWTNAGEYEEIEVSVDGDIVETLAGDETSTEVETSPGRTVSIELVALSLVGESPINGCTLLLPEPPPGVIGLECAHDAAAGSLDLSWINGAPYDGIQVMVGTDTFELEADASSFSVDYEGTGLVVICVVAIVDSLEIPVYCEVDVPVDDGCSPAVITSVTLEPLGLRGSFTGAFDTEILSMSLDGQVLADDIDPSLGSFFVEYEPGMPTGMVRMHLESYCPNGASSTSEAFAVYIPPQGVAEFVRADCDGNGFQDLGDILKLLFHLFRPDLDYAPLPCPDACDFNNDTELNLEDALAHIDFLFRGGGSPELPYPDCGLDSGESLGCPRFDPCADGDAPPIWDTTWEHTGDGIFLDGLQEPPHMQVRVRGPQQVMGSWTVTPPSPWLHVFAHSGEVVVRPPIPYGTLTGRGLDVGLPLIYRSQIDFQSCVGAGWNLWPLTERIVELPDGSIRRYDAIHGRTDDFEAQSADGGDFQVDSFFDIMYRVSGDQDLGTPNTYVLRSPDGLRTTYHGFNGLPNDGMLCEITDRNGNQIRFEYDESGRITQTVDTYGRTLNYGYDEAGRLAHVSEDDFLDELAERVTEFFYNDAHQLVELRLAPITDTPVEDDGIDANGVSGNDFPDGKSFLFAYDGDNKNSSLVDNLTAITFPNEAATGGPPRVQLTYDSRDQCPLYRESGNRGDNPLYDGENAMPPSGGITQFSWEQVGEPTADDPDLPVCLTTITDPNGNVTEYEFNSLAQPIRVEVQNNKNKRSADPDSWSTTYEYNADGLLTSVQYPAGNTTTHEYDSSNLNRSSQGNLLRTTQTPDAARGGDQSQLVTSYSYEPIFNQIRTMTTPRGNDDDYQPPVPDDEEVVLDIDLDLDGNVEADQETLRNRRFTTLYVYDYQEGTVDDLRTLVEAHGLSESDLPELENLLLGPEPVDQNGDGSTSQAKGNVIEMRAPNTVHEEGGDVQEHISTFTYNEFGQLTSSADPEGNTTTYYYHPNSNPTGEDDGLVDDPDDEKYGGYLWTVIRDDNPELFGDPDFDTFRSGQPISNGGSARREGGTQTNFIEGQTIYFRNSAGVVTGVVDARGVLTEYRVNQHNQVVLIIRAADILPTTSPVSEPEPLEAFGYMEERCYDYNGNLVCRRIEDRGDTSGVGANNVTCTFFDVILCYSRLDELIDVQVEVSDDELLTTRYRYDPNGNQVLTILPEGNAVAREYDDRDLLFRETRGALQLPPVVYITTDDPTRFSARGGIPARTTFSYDANGNLSEVSDADDTDCSDGNNGVDGLGERTRHLYDGFDRPVSTVDAAGNQSLRQYDPAGNVVRELVVGSSGGPTPTSDGDVVQPVSSLGVFNSSLGGDPDRPVILGREATHDALSRTLVSSQGLFHTSTATERDVDIEDGGEDVGKSNVIDGDDEGYPGFTGLELRGRVNTLFDYDRSSRLVSHTEDDGDVTTFEYDGGNRMVSRTDPAGNLREYAYDGNDNVIEEQDTDISQLPEIGDEVLVTSYFYDSLNRKTSCVDNLGHRVERRYDSRGNCVAESDAQGPLGPSIERRLFEGGANTSNETNDFGNVTLHYYDGLSRRTRTELILTVNGEGDGVNIGADTDGVKGATPEPDLEQAGGDGIVRTGYVYDGNSNVVATLNDRGVATVTMYDNLDRRIADVGGLTTDSDLSAARILSGRPVPALTSKARTLPLFFPPVLLDGQLAPFKDKLADLREMFPAPSDEDEASSNIYGLDPDGNCLLRIDENGSEFHSAFDALHRLSRGRMHRAGHADLFGDPDFAPVRVTKDPNTTVVHGTNMQDFEYDGLSRLTASSDNNDPDDPEDDCTTTCSYDSLSRVVEETQQVGSGDACVVSSAWRSTHLRSTLTYPDDRTLTYQYDELDRKAVVETPEPCELFYSGPFNLQEIRYPNDTTVRYGEGDLSGYDGLRRPVSMGHNDRDGASMLGFDYEYDRRSNPTLLGKAHDVLSEEIMAYDSASRLVSFERPDSDAQVPLHSSWTLDGVGNWLQVDDQVRNHHLTDDIFEADIGGTTSSLSSDNNGNMTDDSTQIYEWDAFDRLVTVLRAPDADSDPVPIAHYTYDGLSRRLQKEIPSDDPTTGENVITRYCYDGPSVIEERDGEGQTQQQYVRASGDGDVFFDVILCVERTVNGPVGPVTVGHAYHYDALGSVHGLSDAEGSLTEGYMYDAYGRQTVVSAGLDRVLEFGGDDQYDAGAASLLGNPYLFSGQRLDSETGLYNMRSNYYHTELGRFLGRSTGGDGANLFEFGGGNPRVVEYQDGTDIYVRKRPGRTKYSNITLKRGYRTYQPGQPQYGNITQTGDDPLLRKRPGRTKYSDITLKRGYVTTQPGQPQYGNITFKSNDPVLRKRPGRTKYSNITLKRGYVTTQPGQPQYGNITFRGNDLVLRKRPGRKKYSNITLKRGYVTTQPGQPQYGNITFEARVFGPGDAHFGSITIRSRVGNAPPLPPLPFGDPDFDNIKPVTDSSSAAAGLGAEGFAEGSDIRFGDPPSLHTAAHEAAHVKQERQTGGN